MNLTPPLQKGSFSSCLVQKKKSIYLQLPFQTRFSLRFPAFTLLLFNFITFNIEILLWKYYHKYIELAFFISIFFSPPNWITHFLNRISVATKELRIKRYCYFFGNRARGMCNCKFLFFGILNAIELFKMVFLFDDESNVTKLSIQVLN